MKIRIEAEVEEQFEERNGNDYSFMKVTPVTIILDDEGLSKLAIAIFNANVNKLFGERTKNLVEKIKSLDFQSLF